MKQNFLIHVHPTFTGHEFCSLDRIEEYAENNNIPIIVTPHFDLIETEEQHYDGYKFRNTILEQLNELSLNKSNIILGGEFTGQNIKAFDNHPIKDITKIKLFSLHHCLKFSPYAYNKKDEVDTNYTFIIRETLYPFIEVRKITEDELVELVEYAFKDFGVQVFGHINRAFEETFIEGYYTDDEVKEIYDKILNIIKKYNKIVEINLHSDYNSNVKLINTCIEKGIKMVVGLDAHYNGNIKISKMNKYLELIPEELQVSFEEIMLM